MTPRTRTALIFGGGALAGALVMGLAVRGCSAPADQPAALAGSASAEASPGLVPEAGSEVGLPGQQESAGALAEGDIVDPAGPPTGPEVAGPQMEGPVTEGPGAPPPAPRPTIPTPPTRVTCQVSLQPGPAPGDNDVRIVLLASESIPTLWATMLEGDRQLGGPISMAGGRGEQLVQGMTLGATVTVYADPSLDPATEACRFPAQ